MLTLFWRLCDTFHMPEKKKPQKKSTYRIRLKRKPMTLRMKLLWWAVVALCAILLGLFFYYHLSYIPGQLSNLDEQGRQRRLEEERRREAERGMTIDKEKKIQADAFEKEITKEQQRQSGLIPCLDEADRRFKAGWDDGCRELTADSGCALPIRSMNLLHDQRQKDKESCYNLYPKED
jgi:hypothetical protein